MKREIKGLVAAAALLGSGYGVQAGLRGEGRAPEPKTSPEAQDQALDSKIESLKKWIIDFLANMEEDKITPGTEVLLRQYEEELFNLLKLEQVWKKNDGGLLETFALIASPARLRALMEQYPDAEEELRSVRGGFRKEMAMPPGVAELWPRALLVRALKNLESVLP